MCLESIDKMPLFDTTYNRRSSSLIGDAFDFSHVARPRGVESAHKMLRRVREIVWVSGLVKKEIAESAVISKAWEVIRWVTFSEMMLLEKVDGQV